jgi:hypothetical protein
LFHHNPARVKIAVMQTPKFATITEPARMSALKPTNKAAITATTKDSRKRDFPALQTAAEQSFAIALAAANALDPKRGPELALLGWSMCHGLSNLLIDGTLEGMPAQWPVATSLARQRMKRAVDGGG